MELFWVRSRVTRVILATLCALNCTAWVGVVQAAERQSKPVVETRRPWVMVTLTPGPSRAGSHAYSLIKSLSGNPGGLIRHFTQVNRASIAEMDPEFIVLSPQRTPWCRYTGINGVSLQNFLWLITWAAEEMGIPILGICGGHQALALAFGGKVGPIRGAVYDCMPYIRERQSGLVELTVTTPDPIFGGIQESLRLAQSHYDEVKVLPPGFLLLASEKQSPNQIIRHPTLPVYGIQGHPERFHSDNPDGVVLVRNFLKIAGTFNSAVRGHEPALPKLLSHNLSGKPHHAR